MKKTIAFVAVILLSLSTAALAAETIKNWSAPSTWTPPSAQATGRSALVTYPPIPFIPLTPCRLIDTRAGSGFPSGYGPPSMAGGGTQRSFTITGQCGIPVGAVAVSFNFTVWGPPTRGDLRVFPAGGATPNVSTLNWEAGILALANAAVVPMGTGGAITVQIDGPGTVDIFVDVNGYYTGTVGASTFTISSTAPYGIIGYSSTGVGVWGLGLTYGVFGQSTSATGFGVYGLNATGIGVNGLSSTNIGVKGKSTGYNGVWAESTNWDALFASGGRDGAYIQGARYGVIGVSLTAGTDYAGVSGSSAGGTRSAGVLGTNTTALYAAGVKGSVGSGPADNAWAWAGVRGVSDNIGVLGISTSSGVVGAHHTLAGAMQTASYLGYTSTIGLHTIGTTSATGVKAFVEPHPTDAAKVIRYVSLEGNEAGTYFRGKAVVRGGTAEIVVPESFRFVSDEEGLTVHVTPVGRAAQAWIESADLNRIVIGSNRDVTINYIVHGVRKAYKDFEVIADNVEYVPSSVTEAMPTSYPEETRKRLVANGTYNADGTVNTATAERMGWAQKWRDDEASAKAAQEAAATKAKAN